MTIAQEEIFGPVVAMIPFSSMDEAIEIANNVKYGLSASIYTRNVNQAYRAMRDLETGIVYVNAPTIGAEIQLPFRRNERNGQRPSRGRNRGHRFLFGMEDAVRGLFGQAAARANRYGLG